MGAASAASALCGCALARERDVADVSYRRCGFELEKEQRVFVKWLDVGRQDARWRDDSAPRRVARGAALGW